jgi:hypothetical protein
MGQMKRNKVLLRLPFLAVAVFLMLLVSPLLAVDDQYALLVQKTPAFGGTVTPSEGVQMADSYKLVTVTATPRIGYEFVYWLGEVTEPTSSVTTVLVDNPKMVIAVFERAVMAKISDDNAVAVSGGGGGKSSGGSFGGTYIPKSGGGTPPGPRFVARSTRPPVYIPEIEVTPEVEVIPEPATMLLLGSGAMMLLRRNRKRG